MTIKNKQTLYFDRVTRSDKALILKSLAYATYVSENKTANEVAIELVEALEKFRTEENGAYGRTIGAGTYRGDMSQFDSQYTPGLEFGVWKSGKPIFVLSELAELIAKDELSETQFISIIMWNYIQIINNEIIHPLYESLKMASIKDGKLSKEDIYSNSKFMGSDDTNSSNILFNILHETVYFNKLNSRTLEYNEELGSIHNIVEKINIDIIDENSDGIISVFENQETYSDYITQVDQNLMELLEIEIRGNLVVRDKITPLSISENYNLQIEEDVTSMNIPQINYTGISKKRNYINIQKRKQRFGLAAEEIIYKAEKQKLIDLDYPEYAERVKWVSKEEGDGKGYDIKSLEVIDDEVRPAYIEVKSTTKGISEPIDITRNELECSKCYPEKYRIYRIYEFDPKNTNHKMYILKGDMSEYHLESMQFKLYITNN